jgi:hypothetical protein
MSEAAANGNWTGRKGLALGKISLPVLGYVCGAIFAASFYAVWFLAWPPAFGGQVTMNFTPGLGAFFVVFDAFLPVLLILALPWVAVAWVGRRLAGPKFIYFAVSGVVVVFLIGCAAAALDPEMLFIQSPTFLVAAGAAAARQGVAFMIAGLLFGSIYGVCNTGRQTEPVR